MMEKLINFDYKKEKFAIVRPTQNELMKIDMEYRRAFSDGIRCGLMTQFEAKKRFKKDGVWGDEEESNLQSLQMDIVTAENKLKEKSGPEGRKIAFEITEKRNQLLELINDKTQLFSSQTAEGYAMENKTVMFASLCTVDSNGRKVFGSKEKFLAHNDHEFTATCFGQASLADYGMTEDDLNPQYSERKWLIDNEYIDGNSNFTEKYYEEIIKENNLDDDKKTTKKKKKKTKAKKKKKKAAKKK